VAKLLRKRALERSRKSWIDNIKMDLKKFMRMEGGWNWLRTMSFSAVLMMLKL
jgi:hypothetical protein